MKKNIDPHILAACEKVTKKRPKTIIDHILEHGCITTEEIQELYGYDHPPRAVRDVREAGIPLETAKVTSKRTGRKIAVYTFGNPDEIKRGRINGRIAFSKAFKTTLIEHYGERDTLTGQQVEERYLQIDHRIPYEVAGDGSYDEKNLSAYMLLDASNQRKKSWSCEQCNNWKTLLDEKICGSCYWAFPEAYKHIAMCEARRLDIEWRGKEIEQYEQLEESAKKEGVSIASLIKKRLKV